MRCYFIVAFIVIHALLFPLLAFAQAYHPDDASRADSDSRRFVGRLSGSPDPFIQEMVHEVSTEALVTTLRSLQNFQTRYEFSPQREASANWLLNQYQHLGLETQAVPYTFVEAGISDIDIVNDSCAYIVGTSYLLAGTKDGGATWKQLLPSDISISAFDCVDFIDEERGWVIDGIGDCLCTSNGGESWVRSTITFKQFHAVAFLDSMIGLAAGEGGSIFRTSNGGSTWSRCNVPAGNTALRELKVIGARFCWAVGDSGIILSSQDAGLSWVRQNWPANNPMYGIDFVDELRGWAVGGTGYYAVGEAEGSLAKTIDGGQTWRQLAVPPDAGCLSGVYPLDSLRVWIADPRGRLFLSTDGGESWQMKLNLMDGGLRRFAGRIRGDRSSRIGFIGRAGLLYLSSNGGASWEDRTGQLPAELIHTSSNIVAVLPGEITPDREFLLLAHYDSRSGTPMTAAPGVNDNGSGTSLVLEAARVCSGYRFSSTVRFLAVSAEELGLVGSTAYVRAMLQRGTNVIGAINVDMVGYPVTGDSLRLVVQSYNAPNAIRDSVILYQTRYFIDAHLVAAVDSAGRSDHVPLSWAGYPTACLSEGTAAEVLAHDPYLHRTGDTLGNLMPGLVLRATQLAVATAAEFAGPLGISAVPQKPALPAEIFLWQNYPNPFNPVTTIQYALPHRSYVTLDIFNTLGQIVFTLVNGDIGAGYHRVLFDGKGLPSGVYFCRLQARSLDPAGGGAVSGVDTKKLLLVK